MPSCPPDSDSAPRMDRRLAAIAFVDIVGYSILMGRDETRTHERWMAVLNRIIHPQAALHRGRIVKSTGDGVLAEFPSAFDAVQWALDVQLAVQVQGVDDPLQSIALRISVHGGDIITADFDVFGDGVNLAARLQEHAPAGGIVMSEVVHDLVRGSLGTVSRDLGPLDLKNFENPVRAFAIDVAKQGVTTPRVREVGRLPSIAVLPLENLGGDPEDDYFCDGCVEDITLSLAGLRELMVVSRGSTLAYRGRRSDPREVGRMFGVRYILSGSLRRSDRSVRVTVELWDSNSGATLWGEKSEIAPAELFDVQDHIVGRIVAGIAPNVRAAELRIAMRKKPENFTAYDYTLRALHIINSLDKDTFMQAREYLQKAMQEDPEFAMPAAWAARWYSLYVGQGWSADPAADCAKAMEFAGKAIEQDSQNALALATYGHLQSFLLHDYDSALVYFDRALAACPNHSLAWILSSATLSYIGETDQAIRRAEQSLRLSPFDQSLFTYYMFLNLAYYAKGDYREAVKWGRMSANENGLYTANHRILIAGLVGLERLDEAREVAARMLKLEPGFRLSTYERTRQPFRHPQIKERYLEHLRAVGLPE